MTGLPAPSAVVAKVREIAADYPDYVYQRPDSWRCLYFHNGTPSCLVGRALAELGVAADDLPEDRNSDSVYGLFGRQAGDECRAVNWLRLAQSSQDVGLSWGKAVREADRWVGGEAS